MATKPIPVRLSEATLAALSKASAEAGESRSATIVRFIERGLGVKVAAKPDAVKVERRMAHQARAEAKAVPAPKVTAKAESQAQAREPERVAPVQEGGLSENQRAVRALDLPPPSRPAYGSMLKGPPKAKAARRG